MVRFVTALFLVLHGLVHLLYAGQSRRVFELQPGMVWPDGSWAFSRAIGDVGTRLLATVLLALAAVGFVAGGAGILVGGAWWRPVVVAAAVFSAIVYLLLWDGSVHALANKGAVGLLINAAILVAVLVLEWPDFGF
jgi:hypothetical protein